MTDGRDLLEIFDAVLPRLEPYPPGSVPKAGGRELELYEMSRAAVRDDFHLALGVTTGLGALTWLIWAPYVPFLMLYFFAAATAAGGAVALRRFLQLASNRDPARALPDGTDIPSARLEDGVWRLIRDWNRDAFLWNEETARLRALVSGWQALHRFPEARDVEWTERSSRTEAEGLVAAMRGLMADRAALVARRDVIDHRIRALEARLLRLKAADETIIAALPPGPSDEDPPDDG